MPTSRELSRLSNSFAEYAKRIRSTGINSKKQAKLYELASRLAMARAKRLEREERSSGDEASEPSKVALTV